MRLRFISLLPPIRHTHQSSLTLKWRVRWEKKCTSESPVVTLTDLSALIRNRFLLPSFIYASNDCNCIFHHARCLKITEKVSFNIASEASYVLSGQKFIKNTKKVYFGEVLKTVVPDRSLLKGQKLVENAKISIFVLLNHPSQTFLFGKNESSWLVYKWLLSPTRKRRGFLKNF